MLQSSENLPEGYQTNLGEFAELLKPFKGEAIVTLNPVQIQPGSWGAEVGLVDEIDLPAPLEPVIGEELDGEMLVAEDRHVLIKSAGIVTVANRIDGDGLAPVNKKGTNELRVPAMNFDPKKWNEDTVKPGAGRLGHYVLAGAENILEWVSYEATRSVLPRQKNRTIMTVTYPLCRAIEADIYLIQETST